jgi:hypothetical protein
MGSGNRSRQVRWLVGLYGVLLVVEGFLCSRCDLLSSSVAPVLGEPSLRIGIGLVMYGQALLAQRAPNATLLVMTVLMVVCWLGDLALLHAYAASGLSFTSLRAADVVVVLAGSSYLLVRGLQTLSGPPSGPSIASARGA